jgi:hypothetical protein
MRRLSQCLLFAVLCSLVGRGPAAAAQQTDCRQSAIGTLQALAHDGFSIYERMKDKKFFLNWITCDDVQLGLSTAVHESVHHLTADHDAFPLIDGGEVKRPHEVSRFFPPSAIARKFKSDDFVSTYLRPASSSSATDFLYLLDELNAYSHDLKAAVELVSLHSAHESADHRDGLAALMAFVEIYVETAEESQPATWSGLQKPEVAGALSSLWTQAEAVMASSCGIPNFGTEDQKYIRRVCEQKPQSSLQKVLGRAPMCPAQCLHDARTSASEQ